MLHIVTCTYTPSWAFTHLSGQLHSEKDSTEDAWLHFSIHICSDPLKVIANRLKSLSIMKQEDLFIAFSRGSVNEMLFCLGDGTPSMVVYSRNSFRKVWESYTIHIIHLPIIYLLHSHRRKRSSVSQVRQWHLWKNGAGFIIILYCSVVKIHVTIWRVCKCFFLFLFSSPLSLSSFSSPCSQFSLSSPLHVPNPFRKLQQPMQECISCQSFICGIQFNINTDAEESNIWACEYQQTHFIVLAQIFLGLCEETSYTHICKKYTHSMPKRKLSWIGKVAAPVLVVATNGYFLMMLVFIPALHWQGRPVRPLPAILGSDMDDSREVGKLVAMRAVFVVGDAFIPENMYCW